MNRRSTVLGISALFALASLGCATPYHKQVRTEANDRYDLMNAQIAYDQGIQAFTTGQLDKALRSVDAALARFPERGDYLVLKGRILLETHRLENALEQFQTASELEPERADAHYFAGIVLQRWSENDEAGIEYARAFELEDDNAQYLLASAECLIAAQRYDDARQLVEPRMAKFEHNAALQQLLGQIAMLEGKPAMAAGYYAKARLINPDDRMLLEELSRAQFSSGQFTQAHQTIKQLQQLDGTERSDLMHLEARCLAMTDRGSEARNLYLRLTQLSPADPVVWIELGNIAYEVGDFRRVAMCSSRTIALAPDRFEGYLLGGLYEQNQGRHDAAIRMFRKAAELSPNTAWPHVMLGMALEDAGDSERALLAYADALRAEPGNLEARELFTGLEAARMVSENANHEP